MWDLYSIGDSAFLAAVLNSVAMIAGTGAIGQLAGIGFLLAILLTAFQGLMAENGPRFSYQHVFVAAVVYMLMYGPQPGSLSRMRTAARCGSWITCRSAWRRPVLSSLRSACNPLDSMFAEDSGTTYRSGLYT